MDAQQSAGGDIRSQIRDCVHRLEHCLPGQAPIRDFVHHNTLHGYQAMGFREAVREARRVTGQRGYLPPERFRAYLAEGRIRSEDLLAAIDETPELEPGRVLIEPSPILAGDRAPIRRRDLYLAALAHPIGPTTLAQLHWRIEEESALCAFQPDLGPQARQGILESAGTGDQAQAVAALWCACLSILGLEDRTLAPEDIGEPSPERAERLLAQTGTGTEPGPPGGAEPSERISRRVRMDGTARLQSLLDRVGPELSLRTLLLALTGEDIMDSIRPQLIRNLANHLDEGFAPWRNPGAAQGLYTAWRTAATTDLTPRFRDLQAWGLEVQSTPDDPVETIVTGLKRLGLPRELWVPYLERLALELPGWSGMVLWRHLHPDYRRSTAPVSMLDYLALRLVLERIYAQRLCRDQWGIEPSLDMLRWYFRRNPEELLVREALYGGRLPEPLAERAARAATGSDLTRADRDWHHCAAAIWAWRQGIEQGRAQGRTVQDHAWPLFRLAQHLGLAAPDLERLGPDGAAGLLDLLQGLDQDLAGWIWLRAFERPYREQVLAALAANRGRGRWRDRPTLTDPKTVPSVQAIFCMDDREEGIRRHLEELDPTVETLGAAAHYNCPHNWLGLDDREVTALAPVIPAPVIPAHEVREYSRPEEGGQGAAHVRGHERLRTWAGRVLKLGRHGLVGPALVSGLAGPIAGAALVARLAAPLPLDALIGRLRRRWEPPVRTRIDYVAPDEAPPASPERPRLGFTQAEQAERVRALLTVIGLTRGFAPLVAVLGHGSRNRNNPHASAYNCGACSGRFSGPNARLISAMANSPEVRARLAAEGIAIPEGTRFVGGERDTCADTTLWYDTEDLPDTHAGVLKRLREGLDQASRLHAQERSRRFASAPLGLDPTAAHRHVAERAADSSQVRPELGHATNACAVFGRRALTRGVFLDRRAFLVSYDPTQDPDGPILERHLVINGAVGAGIALEYYFSAANDEGYGSGSKVTHNVSGLLGVMDGAHSDLRTGLPRQMIEIHEAMRLLVIVEQSTRVLGAIYERQPAVAELVGGDWVQLVSVDPESGAIARFRPGIGWETWTDPGTQVSTCLHSSSHALGHRGPRPPALTLAPDEISGEIPGGIGPGGRDGGPARHG